MSDPNVFEFDFEGVEPAVFGFKQKLPYGDYCLQVSSVDKFFAKTDGSPDPNKPGLHFVFTITNHPMFEGQELPFWQMLGKKNEQYLLNTLECLVPEFNWRQNGIKIPISQLFQKLIGRPCNGYVSAKPDTYEGRTFIANKLEGLKKFDPSIPPTMPTEGNPPVLTQTQSSPTAQQAASGVSESEVNEFLGNWPGATPQGSSTPAPSDTGNFFSEPF